MAYHLKVQWVPLDDWHPLCCKKMPHQYSPCARVATNLRLSKTHLHLNLLVFWEFSVFSCSCRDPVWLNPAVGLHRIVKTHNWDPQSSVGSEKVDIGNGATFGYFRRFHLASVLRDISDISVHIDKPSCKSRNCSGNNVGRLLLVLVLGLACRHLLLAGKLPSRCHTCKVFPFACFCLETTLFATVCGLSN